MPATATETRTLEIWWGPYPDTDQARFFDDDTQDANLLLTGGWFCIGADTEIYEARLGRSIRVDVMARQGYAPTVLAWTGTQFVEAQATAPFEKGTTTLYRVTTDSGRSITVTDQHRFLTPIGWRSLRELPDVWPALRPRVFGAGRLVSTEEPVLLSSLPSASSSWDRARGSRSDYSAGYRQCDVPLRAGPDTGRGSAPSQDDARGYTRWSSCADGRPVPLLARSHAYQSTVHLSTDGSSRRSRHPFWHSLESDGGGRSDGLVPHALEGVAVAEFPHTLSVGRSPLTRGSVLRMAGDNSAGPYDDVITSVQAVGVRPFYDLHVPGLENYLANGFINHNSGKTISLCGKGLKLSVINHPIQGFWLVPDWSHVHETILPMLTSLDPASGRPWFLRPDQFHYHQTHHLFTWIGGGPIQFLSAEQPHRIAGPQGAFLLVDEPGKIKLEAWRNATARVRHSGAKLRQKCASGTPEGLNWLAEQFSDPSRPASYKLYTMRTRDNVDGLKYAPDFIAQAKDNLTEAEAASYLDGQFGNLTGALAYPPFAEAQHWVPLDLPEAASPLRLTFDFNVDPMTLGICQVVSGAFGPELRVLDWISEYGGATVESCCLKFMDKYPVKWPAGAIVYGDATGKARHVKSLKSNYDIIRDTLQGWALTFKVPSVNPPVADRVNAVNRLLKDAHGRTRLWIRKTEPARLCPTRELVRSLQRTTKKAGTDDLEKKAGETHTHQSDAIGYLVAAEFPVRKPDVFNRQNFGTLTDW